MSMKDLKSKFRAFTAKKDNVGILCIVFAAALIIYGVVSVLSVF